MALHYQTPQQHPSLPPTTTTTTSKPITIEEATVWARLFLEHAAYLQGHDTVPWNYDDNGVATTSCQACNKRASVYYRSNRQPTYTHEFQQPCAGQSNIPA